MLNQTLMAVGKSVSKVTRSLGLGDGSTWPGHIALKANKHFISQTLKASQMNTIIVAGTNGKTTTSSLLATILTSDGKRVLQNASGANLLNGIASSILLSTNQTGKLEKDYAIFEVDENALPLILQEVIPEYVILLNLFRDQLDRYGEVASIATKWQKALHSLPANTSIILNADDPQIAYLGESTNARKYYFSVKSPSVSSLPQLHAVDSLYCPRCGEKLQYATYVFAHLGTWKCLSCGLKQPKSDLDTSPYYPVMGTYNQYNTHAALLAARLLGVTDSSREAGLKKFTPVFGRQENLVLNGRKINIFLSKNPTGFNESLRTAKELKAQHILLVLNDRIPDGRDVSWIWDTDIEGILTGNEKLIISGDRAYDMALRIKYADMGISLQVFSNLAQAIRQGISMIPNDETLFILPTYSAMLDARQIITGKKIL